RAGRRRDGIHRSPEPRLDGVVHLGLARKLPGGREALHLEQHAFHDATVGHAAPGGFRRRLQWTQQLRYGQGDSAGAPVSDDLVTPAALVDLGLRRAGQRQQYRLDVPQLARIRAAHLTRWAEPRRQWMGPGRRQGEPVLLPQVEVGEWRLPGRAEEDGPAPATFQKDFGVGGSVELVEVLRGGEEPQPERLTGASEDRHMTKRLAHSRRLHVDQVLVAQVTPGRRDVEV